MSKTINKKGCKIVALKEELADYEIEDVLKTDSTLVVYFYEIGSYGGSGFLVGKKKDGGWWYSELGHCSCYGATETLISDSKVVHEYEKVKEVVFAHYSDDSRKVLAYIENKKYND